MSATIARLVRTALTIWLLVIVWRHSHWSVALSLTLIYLAWELGGFLKGFERGSRQ